MPAALATYLRQDVMIENTALQGGGGVSVCDRDKRRNNVTQHNGSACIYVLYSHIFIATTAIAFRLDGRGRGSEGAAHEPLILLLLLLAQRPLQHMLRKWCCV